MTDSKPRAMRDSESTIYPGARSARRRALMRSRASGAGRGVRKQVVAEHEPGDVAAEVLAGDLVDAGVVPVVDAARAGLLRRLREADEGPLDTRQRGRGCGEREVVSV